MCVFRSGTDLISLLIFSFVGVTCSISLRPHRLKSDRDEIWPDFSLSKYALIDLASDF